MGRQSTVEQLPPEVLEQLQSWLRDPRVTQMDAVDRVNAVVDQVNASLPEDEEPVQHVSKSALNRYAQRMDKYGEKIRQSREISEMWIGKLGAEPQGKMGQLITEFARTSVFEIMLKLQEIQEEGLKPEHIPGMISQLKDISLTAQRIENATSENVKREQQIRKQAAEEAAERVGRVAQREGLSSDTADSIRREILGVADSE